MGDFAKLLGTLESSFFFQLGTAVICGGIVGLERQLRGKAIGIRTGILICLATQIFVRLSVTQGDSGADPTRPSWLLRKPTRGG